LVQAENWLNIEPFAGPLRPMERGLWLDCRFPWPEFDLNLNARGFLGYWPTDPSQSRLWSCRLNEAGAPFPVAHVRASRKPRRRDWYRFGPGASGNWVAFRTPEIHAVALRLELGDAFVTR
jgi:hypothetical protein